MRPPIPVPSLAACLRPALAAALAFSLPACSDGPTGPGIESETLVVGGTASHLALVESGTGRASRLGPLPRIKAPYALSPDGATLYVIAYDAFPARELVTVDLRGRSVARRARLAEAEALGGQEITASGTQALAVSPDGERLLFATARRNGTTGLAVLDARTGVPTGFAGPFSVGVDGLAGLPPGPALPGGGFLVAGVRTRSEGSSAYLFLLDGAAAVRDSVLLGPASPGIGGGVGQVVASHDGRLAYTTAGGTLLAVDLVERRVAASGSLPSAGRLAVAPDGSGLYLNDPGDRSVPGTGRVYVYGPRLEARHAIELPPTVDGHPRSSRAVAVSRDGRTLYVAGGTPDVGPLYPQQPGLVFVVDVALGRVTAELPAQVQDPYLFLVAP